MDAAHQPAPTYGALPGEWEHFATSIGLTDDLLPVVSNPNAIISPDSKMKALGKTPSQYNRKGQVVGIAEWTEHATSASDIDRWSKIRDYGICIRTRDVRAIDVDVEDATQAAEIEAEIRQDFAPHAPPVRKRSNSAKFLIPFRLPGDYAKRILRTAHGNIEFLANGQQFIAAGTHPSGVRYEWDSPPEIYDLSAEAFERLWSWLEMRFSVAPSQTMRKSDRPRTDRDARDANDAMVDWLNEHWEVRGTSYDGRIDIKCPFEDEHTMDSGASATSYYPAGVGGYQRGHFICLHSHCAGRSDAEFVERIGNPIINDFPDYTEIDKGAALIDDLFASPSIASRDVPAESTPHVRDEFYAFLPDHKFIFRPTCALWSAAGVDGHYRPINGTKPSKWLALHRAVHQMTWWPGKPEIIEDELIASGEVRNAPGRRAYNLYRSPLVEPGNPADIGPWIDHGQAIYPDEWPHLVRWFAHRTQRPGEKLNHALVLGGAQGIGKDSILEPLKRAVGQSNFREIDPEHALGNFNTFVRAIVLRVNEARDLGNANDRFRLYERFKTIIAAPPDVLPVNEKHVSEYPVLNVVGVIYTTNHAVDGLYLPPDDRRHYVAWSARRKEEFSPEYWRAYWTWLEAGGWRNVAAYLRALPLGDFDPKADPPKTSAFYAIVNAGRDPADGELQQALEEMGNPDAVTIGDVVRHLTTLRTAQGPTETPDEWHELVATLTNTGGRRKVPHMFERAGYLQVANADAKDKLWKIGGKRLAIYTRSSLPNAERYRAARVRAAGK